MQKNIKENVIVSTYSKLLNLYKLSENFCFINKIKQKSWRQINKNKKKQLLKIYAKQKL